MKFDHSQIAIQLINVTKTYTIHHEKPTLVEKFVKGKEETFTALDNINLTIKKGEKVGIIGPNGSGKTTLLKVIAGITTPTFGSVQTNGKIVSLIDLEAGFHADLTGFQNIFMNGLLLGISKQEIQHKIAEIIAFADIHQFIDAPLFTYSEGMKLRLGFSIAVYANPTILILDEGLGVADTAFQKKAEKSILHMLKTKRITVLISSHYKTALKAYCNRIVMIDEGCIKHIGKLNLLNLYFSP